MAKKASKKKAPAKKAASKKTAKARPSVKPLKKVTKKKAPAKKAPAKKATTKTHGPSGGGGRKTVKKVAKRRPTAGKNVYSFGAKRTEGDASMRALLGGKGANLADMTSIGLPVPPGFTITTDTCERYHAGGGRLPTGLMNEVHQHMAALEKERGCTFGDAANPLLVSVRSGAAVSMPGMMDTILNLGLNDESVEGLAERTGNRRFAFDAYRRLIDMFGTVVMGVSHAHFERAFDEVKSEHKASGDTEVPAEGLEALCEAYKDTFRKFTGTEFPQNPFKQLELAIEAVFRSWESDRAKSYRRLAGIGGLNGTAVNVQSMVFGNMGEDSGTGVAFTRNPSTGENVFYGEFLVNAQGEDVVAGIRTPRFIDEMPKWNKQVHKQLLDIKKVLEQHYLEMQDIEFTIERGELFMLQTRTGKRTGPAAVRIACDMVREKLIDEPQALLRIPAGDLTQLLLPSFSETKKELAKLIVRGLAASPGAAVGKPAFTAAEAVERKLAGESVILVRHETSPEDVTGMHSAAGILTSTGGMTSHAAVVARGWGKCCVAGAGQMSINEAEGWFEANGVRYDRASVISVDGSTGEVLEGAVPTRDPELGGDFAKVMRWADRYRKLSVRTNADTPEDAKRAREFGAEGIGLCRSEHMFFESDRIMTMRELILAEGPETEKKALEKLLGYQRSDFISILRAMKGLPVTIRLLDPPLHEFLPNDDETIARVARVMRTEPEVIRNRVSMLHELNPMLGHRGCRLAVTHPEILKMQVRAITEASIEVAAERIKVQPEIMIPLVGTAREVAYLRKMAEEVMAEVREESEWTGRVEIKIGTMIEVPRAAICADEIAEHADFFSFGTNDLTQLTFGFSRDDVNVFLPSYLEAGILDGDPFQTLDLDGVGWLIERASIAGREANEKLKVGICGEHGGDPESVLFCHKLGLDYVSCSPFRVPIARLAAAQAAVLTEQASGE